MRILRLNSKTFPPFTGETAELRGMDIVQCELFKECSSPGDFDAVMVVSEYLRTEDIKRLAHCKIISRMGNGCDKIDIRQAALQNIVVTNVPDSFTCEVADHTIALLLACLRKLKDYERLMRCGKRNSNRLVLRRISEMKLGIIGYGRIGRAVATRAKAFGMSIAACDPFLDQANSDVELLELDALLETSDAVVLLCPYVPGAKKPLISMRELQLMKRDAVFINTARGELVDEAALAEVLATGRLTAAGIDVFAGVNVFQPDGFRTDHPFFKLENVILTPHIAAISTEALEETGIRAAKEVVRVLSGENAVNVVNKKLIKDLKICTKQ